MGAEAAVVSPALLLRQEAQPASRPNRPDTFLPKRLLARLGLRETVAQAQWKERARTPSLPLPSPPPSSSSTSLPRPETKWRPEAAGGACGAFGTEPAREDAGSAGKGLGRPPPPPPSTRAALKGPGSASAMRVRRERRLSAGRRVLQELPGDAGEGLRGGAQCPAAGGAGGAWRGLFEGTKIPSGGGNSGVGPAFPVQHTRRQQSRDRGWGAATLGVLLPCSGLCCVPGASVARERDPCMLIRGTGRSPLLRAVPNSSHLLPQGCFL